MFLTIIALTAPASAAPGPTPEPNEEQKIDWPLVGASVFDVMLLRPLGVATTLGGFCWWFASGPLMVPSQGLMTTWDLFVMVPADYTFVRPLGDF